MKKLVQIVVVGQIHNPQQNEPAVLINPQLTLSVLSVPTTFSFGLVIITTNYNFAEVKNFSLRILNLDAKNVLNHRLAFQNTFEKSFYEQVSNDNLANSTFNIELNNFVFKNQGTYKVEVILDDEVFTQEFNVRVEEED
ncbi:hypothetical protein ACFC90_15310 [Enterococcus casseliflavus]|uniref:DUF6941 family protein n=1 Tax=Enterococcus casseliflavus TaxID=37734 RepID=UPI002069138C|nr:MAG TPA: hypothetical protein [Caudoviricetes sp.]